MTYSNTRLQVKDAALSGGVATFTYNSTEPTAAIDAADYFSDGGDFGMKQGDIVFVRMPDSRPDIVNLHRVFSLNGRAATTQWFGQAKSSILAATETDMLRALDPGFSGAVGAAVVNIALTTLTLTDAYHGRMLNFTSGSAVTVTVPAGLRADFSCGWSQGGAGTVTFQAGAGATLNSAAGFLTSGAQYVVGGLTAFAKNVFRLYRNTVS